MAFETFIGWRYLFRRGPRQSAVVLFFLALVIAAVGGLFFIGLMARWRPGMMAPITPVLAIIFGALFAIVFGLLMFFSVFTSVAIVGVMIGVSALVVVLSVTSGFQEEFKDKVLGVNGHIIVMKWGADFKEYRDLEQRLGAMPGVVGAAPVIFDEMQAAHGTTQSSIVLQGVDPRESGRVLSVNGQVVEGSIGALEREDGGILVGTSLAKKLHVRMGDTIKIMSKLSSVDTSLFGRGGRLPKSGDFRVVGIYHAGFEEYDARFVYLNLADAQQLMGHGDVVSGVYIKLRNADDAPAFAKKLEPLLKAPYRIIDWAELNRNLFAALRLQKFVISLFLTIIIIVAAFNIVASLTMIVLSKRKEIAILKSMGASAGGIARVFQVAGMTIGAVGVVAGIAFGLLLCLVAARYRYPLDPKIYLVSELPVRVRLAEVALTAGVTLLICLAATIYPSIKASDLRPVEGLRYE
jgi:lipoprotein-releasing system permease protein